MRMLFLARFSILLWIIPTASISQTVDPGDEKITGNVKSIDIHYYDNVEQSGEQLSFSNKNVRLADHTTGELVVTFDKNGNALTRERLSYNGNWLFKESYTYDEFGNKTSHTERNSRDSLPRKLNFQNHYDDRNNAVRATIHGKDGGTVNYFEHVYDANNNLIESKQYLEDGSLYTRFEMEYDAEGHLIESRRYSYPNGNELFSIYRFKYNEQGLRSEEEKYSQQNKFQKRTKLTYDEQGNVIKVMTFEGPVITTKLYKYTYDEKGNWITCLIYDKDFKGEQLSKAVQREIIYY